MKPEAPQIRSLHAEIIRLIEACRIQFRVKPYARNQSEGAAFFPPTFQKPYARIWINRLVDDADRDCFEEVCSLAHEFGHYLSWLRSTQYPKLEREYQDYEGIRDRFWAVYGDSKFLSSVSRRECRALLREERRAWAFGRLLLRSLGFADWDGFARARGTGIGPYFSTLKTDMPKWLSPPVVATLAP